MSNIFLLILLEVYMVADVHGQIEGSGVGFFEVEPQGGTYNTPHLDNSNPRWCRPLTLSHGVVRCFPPRRGYHHSSLGTRCQVTCDQGSRLVGPVSLQCLPSRRWSGVSYCRKLRCPVLPSIYHGTVSCTSDLTVDSRCDYACHPGYVIEGDRSRICLEDGTWSGSEPICADHDPPTIKCPRSLVKVAGPGKLSARVSWNLPIIKDSADTTVTDVKLMGPEPGSEFKEGIHVIRYKAYDKARNKAMCKFNIRVEVRKCPTLKAPPHGYLKCTMGRNIYGAVCEYFCDGGYERRGMATRVCQFNRRWAGDPPACVMMEINTDVRTAAALLDQFYERRRLLIVSTPSPSHPHYQLQNMLLHKAGCGLDLRQVTVLELLGTPPREVGRIKDRRLDAHVIEGLRQALRISRSYFSIVLLDEHGIDRERFITPTTSEELYFLIETYVMGEEERERLEKRRDFCD